MSYAIPNSKEAIINLCRPGADKLLNESDCRRQLAPLSELVLTCSTF